MSFQLLTPYDGAANLSGWLVSTKYDGHRAMWTGAGFVSREGHALRVPASLACGLPATALDGELFSGTDHDEMQSILISGVDDPRWERVRFMVFDAPTVPGGKRERVAAIPVLVADAPRAVAVAHEPVKSAADALARMTAEVARGGEGVVVCDPSAPYQVGRSRSALKMKPGEGGEVRTGARVRPPHWERYKAFKARYPVTA